MPYKVIIIDMEIIQKHNITLHAQKVTQNNSKKN
jgi:hypothetical protein